MLDRVNVDNNNNNYNNNYNNNDYNNNYKLFLDHAISTFYCCVLFSNPIISCLAVCVLDKNHKF